MTDGSCKWCISGGEGKCIPSHEKCHRHKPEPRRHKMRSNKNFKKCLQCAELQQCGTYSADIDNFVCGGFKRDSKGNKIKTHGCNGPFNRKEAIQNCHDEFKPHHDSRNGIIID